MYSLLYWVTSGGRNVRLAQWLFGGLYLINLAVVMKIYTRISKVSCQVKVKNHQVQFQHVSHSDKFLVLQAVHFPPILLLFLCVTAHRVHSIFVLRMFNDAVVMLILYIALLFMIENHWILACIVYRYSVLIHLYNVFIF